MHAALIASHGFGGHMCCPVRVLTGAIPNNAAVIANVEQSLRIHHTCRRLGVCQHITAPKCRQTRCHILRQCFAC